MVLQLNYTAPVMISGGPLTPTYRFTQLHFHWGVNDSLGSEDLINNHRYVEYLNTSKHPICYQYALHIHIDYIDVLLM